LGIVCLEVERRLVIDHNDKNIGSFVRDLRAAGSDQGAEKDQGGYLHGVRIQAGLKVGLRSA
jgi:hypothetical protein